MLVRYVAGVLRAESQMVVLDLHHLLEHGTDAVRRGCQHIVAYVAEQIADVYAEPQPLDRCDARAEIKLVDAARALVRRISVLYGRPERIAHRCERHQARAHAYGLAHREQHGHIVDAASPVRLASGRVLACVAGHVNAYVE